jgi:hypothetical protein
MQPLSRAALGPEAQRIIEDFQKLPVPDFARDGAIAVGVSITLAILAVWLASQLFAKDRAGILRAIQTNLMWLVSIVAVAVLTGLAFLIAGQQGSPTMVLASLIIGGILMLYAWISVPMRIYKFSFLQAIGLIVVTWILQTAGQLVAERVLGDPLNMRARATLGARLARLPSAEATGVIATLRRPAGFGRDAGPSIAERQADLRKMYAELQARRELLREDDKASVDAYTRDNARYIDLLTELQRDAAAERR